jgi:predicted component of type VI protein secretion system
MAKIQVYLKNELVHELDLSMNHEVLGGRSSECQIKLESEEGISRRHFSILWDGQQFTLNAHSQYGHLFRNQQEISKGTSVSLKPGESFEVPPYLFKLSSELESKPVEEFKQIDFADHTVVSTHRQDVYRLHLSSADGRWHKEFELEGDRWIAGRQSTCPIYIDDASMSRTHFEIIKEAGQFKIRDLDSRNGTLLNLRPVTNEWLVLRSRDEIRIGDNLLFTFEIKDASFQAKLASVPAEYKDAKVIEAKIIEESSGVHRSTGPSLYQEPKLNVPPPNSYDTTSSSAPSQMQQKTKIIRFALFAIILLGGSYLYLQEPTSDKPQATEFSSEAPKTTQFDALASLQPTQREKVLKLYRNALKARDEDQPQEVIERLEELAQILPVYLDSEKLLRDAKNSIAILESDNSRRAQEKEIEKLQESVAKEIKKCKVLHDSKKSSLELTTCFQDLMLLDPTNATAAQWISEAKNREEVDAFAKDQRIKSKALVDRLENQWRKTFEAYSASDSEEKSVRLLTEFLSLKLPDPNGRKNEARQLLAQMKNKAEELRAKHRAEADKLFQAGQLQDSFKAYKKALEFDPDNEVIKGRMDSILVTLRKNNQPLFQESILEESLGELDSASEKWKKIIQSSVPEEEYYQKAKTKVKRMGSL